MSNFWLNALIDVLLVVFVVDCVFMGLVIMMQRSKQEGLGAAFGGGFTDSIWGAQTSQVLVKATTYAAALFFILSVTLARLYSMRESTISQAQNSPVQQQLEQIKAPAATPSALTPPASAPSATATNTPAAPAVAPAKTPAKTPTH
jgi:preprotein translocase subunit SecG